MPIFRYKCQKCEQEVEEIQGEADPSPERVCPKGDMCTFEALPWFKQKKAAVVRFAPGSSGGAGGWERQGDVLIRKVKGKHSTRYGEGV